MKATLLSCILGLFMAPAWAQSPDFSAECKAQMQKLAYFVGNWKGEAIHSRGPGKTETISQQEKIEWRLNEVVLLIEGTGRKMGSSDIVFNAFAVVNYDPNEKKFKFKSHVKEGFTTNAYFDVVAENKFEWGFDIPNGSGKTRYVITLDPAKETWYETGEFSKDGTKWSRFIELNLVKLD